MPRCECFCARDVGVLLLRALAYICLAVCRLGSNGQVLVVSLGGWGV